MKSNDTSTLRITGALSVPIAIAAATVALAGYLGLSGLQSPPPPARHGQIVVLDDLTTAGQPSDCSNHG